MIVITGGVRVKYLVQDVERYGSAITYSTTTDGLELLDDDSGDICGGVYRFGDISWFFRRKASRKEKHKNYILEVLKLNAISHRAALEYNNDKVYIHKFNWAEYEYMSK